MSEERQETIDDIVDDIRAQNQGLPEDSYALSPIADRIEIVYNGVRYRLVEGRDCTNHCSFRKADGPYYCERGCYLPRWVKRLGISVDFWLERVDPNDAELRAENARLRAALKPVIEKDGGK